MAGSGSSAGSRRRDSASNADLPVVIGPPVTDLLKRNVQAWATLSHCSRALRRFTFGANTRSLARQVEPCTHRCRCDCSPRRASRSAARELDAVERKRVRQLDAAPLADKLHEWARRSGPPRLVKVLGPLYVIQPPSNLAPVPSPTAAHYARRYVDGWRDDEPSLGLSLHRGSMCREISLQGKRPTPTPCPRSRRRRYASTPRDDPAPSNALSFRAQAGENRLTIRSNRRRSIRSTRPLQWRNFC
jgi:hypothetical protein